MSIEDSDASEPKTQSLSSFPWGILAGFFVIALGGALAFVLLSKPIPPAPPEVASDPLLSQGRTIYLARCIACHGIEGRGDGPLAKNLIGPPPGNLTDSEWKHGEQPDQVIRVIAEGVPNTRMDGWGKILEPAEIRAVSAYVYYLAKRPVPKKLRTP